MNEVSASVCRLGTENSGVPAKATRMTIIQRIKLPQSLIPDTTMEDTFMTDEEVADLSRYLLSLK